MLKERFKKARYNQIHPIYGITRSQSVCNSAVGVGVCTEFAAVKDPSDLDGGGLQKPFLISNHH
jgi:hypothetical protein